MKRQSNVVFFSLFDPLSTKASVYQSVKTSPFTKSLQKNSSKQAESKFLGFKDQKSEILTEMSSQVWRLVGVTYLRSSVLFKEWPVSERSLRPWIIQKVKRGI